MTVTEYKYQGKERDTETGYDYFEARYYDSSIGRFLQVDPLAEKGPWISPYASMFNNPLNFQDKDGRWPSYANSFVKWAETTTGFKWIFTSHEEMLSESLSRFASSRELSSILKAQTTADEYQSGNAQFTHAMNDKTNFFRFLNKQVRYDSKTDQMVEGKAASLGERLHAITDLTSPSHEGFQMWDNPSLFKQASHVLGELHGSSSRKEYTQLLATWYYNWDKNGSGNISQDTFSSFQQFSETGTMTFKTNSQSEAQELIKKYKAMGYEVRYNGEIQ